MTYKPPRRPPGDRSHLERLVQALSIEEGIAADRLRRWVSVQVLLGALGRDDDDERRFLLKSGVAMELRLRLRARATRDVDILVLPEEEADLTDTLRDALEEPYLNFGFRIARIQGIQNTSAQHMGRPWATLRLEASPPGPERAEAEQISAFSLTQLGLEGPEQVACQSLRYQMATKLHAVTERFEIGENDRFRDLIDLLLLRDLHHQNPQALTCYGKRLAERGRRDTACQVHGVKCNWRRTSGIVQELPRQAECSGCRGAKNELRPYPSGCPCPYVRIARRPRPE